MAGNDSTTRLSVRRCPFDGPLDNSILYAIIKLSVMEERVKTFKEYWLEQGGKINEKRKKRYQDDEEYRKGVREQQKDAYRDKKQGRPQRGATRVFGDRNRPVRTRFLVIRGQRIRVYSTTEVASKLNITRPWLLKLEKNGIIPAPSHFNGMRLYTQDEVDALLDSMREVAKTEKWTSSYRWANTNLPELIRERWKRLKNGVASK